MPLKSLFTFRIICLYLAQVLLIVAFYCFYIIHGEGPLDGVMEHRFLLDLYFTFVFAAAVIFLVYRTTLERFLYEFDEGLIKPNDPAKPLPAKQDLKISDMLNSNFELLKRILQMDLSKCFLPVTATLNDARQAMQDNTLCQDVFITQTGKRTEKVLGWITNTKIIEKSELFTKAGSN